MKPVSPKDMTALAHRIRAAAVVICGDCTIAALALIQAQCIQEGHIVEEHANDEVIHAFDAAVADMKAKSVRALDKVRANEGPSIRTNSAGGSC